MFDGTINVLIKGFISLIFLFLIIKLLGKKQVSQLNVFDYVIGISLGNLAAEMTINSDITIINGFLAMTIYGMCSLFVSFITSKSIIARRLISGVPVVLMEKGKISKDALKKVKIDLNDLMQDAREDGIFDLSKVEYAIMEVSGKVTFLLKSEYEPLTSKNMHKNVEKNNLSAVLIMDGNIMYNNLKNYGKKEKWLMQKIQEHGFNDVKNIFLLLCNGNNITIYDNKYHIKGSVLE
jgi:uncharacterized membrane protein YcaP (DUF421 family)